MSSRPSPPLLAPEGCPGDGETADKAGRSLAWRLAALSAVGVAGAALCYLVMVRTSLGQRFDNTAFQAARDRVPGQAAAEGAQLRRITADSFAAVLVVLVVLGALRRRLLLGVGVALAAGVAVVATDFLKNQLLTRPLLTAQSAAVQNTFPSGHTATAVACAMALVLVSPTRWRGVAAVTAGGYAWVTAAEVQTAGWHRPSDAIGAAFLAFSAITAAGAIVAMIRPVTWDRRSHHRVAQAVLGFVGIVGLLVIGRGLIRVLGYLRTHRGVVGAPGSLGGDAYFTGLAVTVEVVVVLLMVLLALVGQADLGGPTRRPGRKSTRRLRGRPAVTPLANRGS